MGISLLQCLQSCIHTLACALVLPILEAYEGLDVQVNRNVLRGKDRDREGGANVLKGWVTATQHIYINGKKRANSCF